MREILFHGKRLDNGEWVEGYLLKECNYATCSWNLAIEYKTGRFGKLAYDVVEIDPETVSQFVGLCDKNGKKIFEGDICQIKNHCLISKVPFVIEWEDFVYNGWVWKDLDENKNEDCFTRAVAKICEVIGNVHDNPELLETKHE